ncbi:porin family protein [uncultured Kordia sp.]|uniref:porin family protein n=1 Tax=uncultured Kordia sp. TaxID=507699 RepID=UPI00260F8842|nr:porin family protein [uncultured Kordia sp.]
MKKLLIVLTGLFFIANANAQDVKFGVKAGVNFANVEGAPVNLDSRTGFHVGVTTELMFSDKFSVQPEVIYSAQGAKLDNIGTTELDYIAIPVMAKYYIIDGLSIEAGPQVSFLVNDTVTYEDSALENDNANVESFDFGVNFGLGYKFNNGFFAQARYNLGIAAIQENPDITNRVFQLSVGYQF